MGTSTLQLRARTGLPGAVRERGASALDRRATVWAAPDPATMVIDAWGAPTAAPLPADNALSPWPAPMASQRVDMAAPAALTPPRLLPPHPSAVPISTVEPLHAVQLPDLVALARTRPTVSAQRGSRSSIPSKPLSVSMATPVVPLPPPTIDTLVMSDAAAATLAPPAPPRRRTGLVLGAAALGLLAIAAVTATLVTLI